MSHLLLSSPIDHLSLKMRLAVQHLYTEKIQFISWKTIPRIWWVVYYWIDHLPYKMRLAVCNCNTWLCSMLHAVPAHFLINFHCLQTSVTAVLCSRQVVTNERASSAHCSQWESRSLTSRSLSCSELHLKHLSWSVTPMQTLIITPGLAILT